MIKKIKSDYMIKNLYSKKDEKKLYNEKKRYIVKKVFYKEIKYRSYIIRRLFSVKLYIETVKL